jgi:hypothetical protein
MGQSKIEIPTGGNGSARAASGETQKLSGCVAITQSLHQRLDKEIRRVGMTWEAIASELGMSRQNLTASMQRCTVSYTRVSRVCSILGIETSTVMDGECSLGDNDRAANR